MVCWFYVLAWRRRYRAETDFGKPRATRGTPKERDHISAVAGVLFRATLKGYLLCGGVSYFQKCQRICYLQHLGRLV